MKGTTSTSKEAVTPFDDGEEEEVKVPGVALLGPYHVGLCVVEIIGPLQVVFAVLALAALIFLLVEWIREGLDVLRTAVGVAFALLCLYLVWLSKSIYLLRAFRKEIDRYSLNNRELQGEVAQLEDHNRSHEANNREQERLQAELSDRVSDLFQLERLLGVFSQECKGSVLLARQSLERLERNVKLDSVNSALLLFTRANRDGDGKVSGGEVFKFVDSLSFLWSHLPHFEAERMRATIAKRGRLAPEDVPKLVDGMMSELESGDPAAPARKLETTLLGGSDASDGELDRSAVTICPPNARMDP